MTQSIIDMAREAGLYVGENLSGVMLVGHAKSEGLLIHLDVADLNRFAVLVRNAALEDAVVEVEQGIWFDKTTDEILASIADAIRQLKETK